jgi:nucleotide-binding universal stress UspA family protein
MTAQMTFGKLLVPVDFDETSDQAVKTAVAIASKVGASITLLHTVEIYPNAYANFGAMLPPPDVLSSIETAARKMLDTKLDGLRAAVPSADAIVTTGVPWRQILAAVDARKPDMVVMGTHARRGLERALLGSVAEKVVRMCPVPVLLVPCRASAT